MPFVSGSEVSNQNLLSPMVVFLGVRSSLEPGLFESQFGACNVELQKTLYQEPSLVFQLWNDSQMKEKTKKGCEVPRIDFASITCSKMATSQPKVRQLAEPIPNSKDVPTKHDTNRAGPAPEKTSETSSTEISPNTKESPTSSPIWRQGYNLLTYTPKRCRYDPMSPSNFPSPSTSSSPFSLLHSMKIPPLVPSPPFNPLTPPRW